MMNMDLKERLGGGDLRSIGEANKVADEIDSQERFDSLFDCLHEKDRLIVMRAADAIEKITLARPEYLSRHKDETINFCSSKTNIEFKWHLALLLSRLSLSAKEQRIVFGILKKWTLDPKESKIVRVNALQSLYELSKQYETFKGDFYSVVSAVEKENVPSLTARIKKLKL